MRAVLYYLAHAFSGGSTTDRQHFLTMLKMCCSAPLLWAWLRLGKANCQLLQTKIYRWVGHITYQEWFNKWTAIWSAGSLEVIAAIFSKCSSEVLEFCHWTYTIIRTHIMYSTFELAYSSQNHWCKLPVKYRQPGCVSVWFKKVSFEITNQMLWKLCILMLIKDQLFFQDHLYSELSTHYRLVSFVSTLDSFRWHNWQAGNLYRVVHTKLALGLPISKYCNWVAVVREAGSCDCLYSLHTLQTFPNVHVLLVFRSVGCDKKEYCEATEHIGTYIDR